jgi:RNA-splicing ligase RtcB
MPIQLVLNKARVPVKLFTQDIDADARRQLLNVAQLPIVFGHVAAMPDVHHGIGATVGSVIGTKSYIVRGKGNAQSFCSCSHGAGRRMSRTEAKRRFNRFDLAQQTQGVECRKDGGVVDEIPGAYKDIDTVMANQTDLVDIVHTLKQVICIKG